MRNNAFWLFIAVALFPFQLRAQPAQQNDDASRPNILIIMVSVASMASCRR